MIKWYEDASNGNDVIVASKVRLVRNLKQHCFSSNLSDQDSEDLIFKIRDQMQDMEKIDPQPFKTVLLSELSEIERLAYRERRILNSAMVEKKKPIGLMISEDESTSLVLNGDDHIRIQTLKLGFALSELWEKANIVDDYVNEKFEYAFDPKYGYLTTFPTNVGTGMRVSLILHLPALSSGTKFRNLIGDMGRFGITVKGVFGEGMDNHGFLYELSNQKTLGQSEQTFIDVVGRVAGQLVKHEKKIRKMALQEYNLQQVDEIYKSFGILKYARRLTLKETMIYLSHIMLGVSEKLIDVPEDLNIYKIIMGAMPANLQRSWDRPLSKEELEAARAEYVRSALPDIK